MKHYFLRVALIASIFVAGVAQAATTQETLETQIETKLVEQIIQAIGLEAQNTANMWENMEVCRNTQIQSYAPSAGSKHLSLDTVSFIASDTAQTDSFAIVVNKQSVPVEYQMLQDGTYMVWASIPDTAQSFWYVEMRAQSDESNACNDGLETLFTKTTPVVTTPRAPVVSQATPVKRNTSVTKAAEPVVVVQEEDNLQATGTDESDQSDIASLGGTNDEDQVASSLWDVTQTGSVLGGTSSIFGNGTCNTFGSSWTWYMWLFVMWLYIIVVWLLLVTYVEVKSNTPAYSQRLAIVLISSTVVMLAVWFLTNPCFTHIWIPIVTVILGGVLFWLYGETEVPHISHDHNARH